MKVAESSYSWVLLIADGKQQNLFAAAFRKCVTIELNSGIGADETSVILNLLCLIPMQFLQHRVLIEHLLCIFQY
jgi:hypothetical protein